MLTRICKEFRRHRAVRRLRADPLPDPMLDRIAEQAAAGFDAPIGIISLIDRHTQWLRAAHGFAIGQLPRCESVCNHVIDRGDLLEVCSPHTDPRFAGLPVVVGDPHILYYIGTAIQSVTGLDIGTLCVADTRMRPAASADQRAYLRALAARVTKALDLRPDCVAMQHR